MATAEFMTDDFLLDTPMARALYHGYAAEMPIYDYHCHLPPDEIAGDKEFENLTQIGCMGITTSGGRSGRMGLRSG
jgi:glucuronate isomerase